MKYDEYNEEIEESFDGQEVAVSMYSYVIVFVLACVYIVCICDYVFGFMQVCTVYIASYMCYTGSVYTCVQHSVHVVVYDMWCGGLLCKLKLKC